MQFVGIYTPNGILFSNMDYDPEVSFQQIEAIVLSPGRQEVRLTSAYHFSIYYVKEGNEPDFYRIQNHICTIQPQIL